MENQILELDGGLKVVYSRVQSNVVHLGLMAGVGSSDDGCFSGMAHFVEHMWFKGTTSRVARQIIDDIENVGGDFNAYTSKEETCVHISVLKDSFKMALDVLSDVFYNSTFPADEIEKEREVICDEIDSYDDSPSELIFDEFEELLFTDSPLSMPILGTKKSLRKINTLKIKEFYEKEYLNSKVVLSFVGDISFNEFIAVAQDYFICRKVLPLTCPKEFYDQKIFTPFNVSKKKSTSQCHCILGCKTFSWYDKERFPLTILNNILGGSQFSSILNYSLREQNGLTYTVESNYTPYSHSGSFLIYFGTEPKKVDACYSIIKQELSSVCNSSLLDNKIDVYKKQILGQLALSYDNNLNVMISQAKSVLVYDKVESFDDVVKKIERIDSTTLKDVANQVLDFDKMSFLKYS